MKMAEIQYNPTKFDYYSEMLKLFGPAMTTQNTYT